MTATLLLVHGRSQASNDEIAGEPARLAAYVEGKRRGWLGGLAKGLLAVGRTPVGHAVFPFYGNAFADAITAHEAAGGHRPELESLRADRSATDTALVTTRGSALLDAANALGFDPVRELSRTDPEMAEAMRARPDPSRELDWGNALKLPVLRAALQFVSRKTGAPAVIIERFLDDVAYYLELPKMRELVLDVVRAELDRALPNGGELVVVGHSLGSIVAYDLLTDLPAHFPVRLFVTAGSPLGYPIVQTNLRGARPGVRAGVPGCVPARPGGWLNAYDVRDVVALVHPLAGDYAQATAGQLVDERTHNATGPHDIADYLSDPDVAGPIGAALA